MLIFTSVSSNASEDSILNPSEWSFGDNDKVSNTKPESPLITGRFAQNPWLFDISNQYEDFGESEALAASEKSSSFGLLQPGFLGRRAAAACRDMHSR